MNDKKELTLEEVEHIARLARLKLEKVELEEMRGDLLSILEYVGQLEKIDVEGVEPTHHATGALNVTREDVVDRPDDHTKKLIANAPASENNQIKVKAVLEDRE